jgi:hypothetical protein
VTTRELDAAAWHRNSSRNKEVCVLVHLDDPGSAAKPRDLETSSKKIVIRRFLSGPAPTIPQDIAKDARRDGRNAKQWVARHHRIASSAKRAHAGCDQHEGEVPRISVKVQQSHLGSCSLGPLRRS